jgi:hypothetical protein
MKEYTYINHKTGEIRKVFTHGDIVRADEIYQRLTGLNPVKLPHVGCRVVEVTK